MAWQIRLIKWACCMKKNIGKYSFFIAAIASAFFTSCGEQSTSPQVNKPSYYCQYNGYTYSNYSDYQATCVAPTSSANETYYCQYNGYTYSNYADFLATCIAPVTYYCANIISSYSLASQSSSSKQFVCDIPKCGSTKCYSEAVPEAIKNNPRDSDAAYLEAARACGCANRQCSKAFCYTNSEKGASAEKKCQLQYDCACYN